MTTRSLTATLFSATLLTTVALPAQDVLIHAPAQVEKQVIIKHDGAGPMPGMGEHTVGMMGYMQAEFGPSMKPVKGAPYTADSVSESVQVLGDGNRIVRKSAAQMARDGEGRTYRREKMEGIGPWTGGQPHETILINDPVAKINWVLDPASRTANKLAVSMNESTGPVTVMLRKDTTDTAPGAGQQTIRIERKVETRSSQNVREEALGKRVIEGIQCDGTKSVTTIPAGEVGNERPIEVVSERWFSPELQMVVMSKRSDPRMGDTAYQLTNIRRAEPARSLFEVPADFTLREGKAVINTVIREKK